MKDLCGLKTFLFQKMKIIEKHQRLNFLDSKVENQKWGKPIFSKKMSGGI